MKRDTARLSAAASRAEQDLQRTTGQGWTCAISDGYVLHVTNGAVSEEVLLEENLEDEHWFVPAGASPVDLNDGLDADADELLATEVAEAVRALGVDWPLCAEHHRLMEACSSGWYCNGTPYHDVAAIGELEAHQTEAGRSK